MFRLLGFLIGSAAAFVLMLTVLGTPEFHIPEPEIDQQRFDAAVDMLRDKRDEVAEIAEVVVDEVADAVDAVSDNAAVAIDKALPESVAIVDLPALAEEPLAAFPADPEPEPIPAMEAPVAEPTLWFSFWNPFRSEIAANGFVSRLEKVTGLDYRVVKVKTGVYEVAFPYSSDDERVSKLSRISAATGLDLPDT